MILGAVLASGTTRALGQDGSSSIPAVNAPPRAIVPASDAHQELLDRLRKMEARLDQVTRQNEDLSREVHELKTVKWDQSQAVPGVGAAPRLDTPRSGGTGGEAQPSAGGGSKTSGGDPTTTGRAQEVGNRHIGKLSLKSFYDFDDDGFGWSTQDDEYTLAVRALTQLEARSYQQKHQFPVSNGFYNPRTRVYLEGRLTKPIQYEMSFQNTFDSLNLLDAYLNFNYDARFQLRIGRYKTPFTYEWYRIHVWHLLAPERSLFANNYEGNRRFGLMGWGTVFDQRMEYAVGTFNGQRNSYQPFDSLQDVMAFLNFKPFYNMEEDFPLRDLHVGGSVDAGQENQSPVPAVLRTNSAPSAAGVDSSAAANSATLPFLAFNPNVRERGPRALWELHAAYYYRGLTLLGAWQGGYESYAQGAAGAPNRIPIGGWYAQAGYILTGETIRDRTLIDPLRPFDLRHGHFGLGAFEVTARYSELELNRRVFTTGLADPALWTNHTQMVDVGFNWYLNKSVKIYFDWEHAMFGNPVVNNTATDRKSLHSNLFWLRFQVYF
ncbi:MAG: phosphate-selective porin [Planctomycetota bacterium]|nr:phosphate-selective porin [Planctomycetota bacterium]